MATVLSFFSVVVRLGRIFYDFIRAVYIDVANKCQLFSAVELEATEQTDLASCGGS